MRLLIPKKPHAETEAKIDFAGAGDNVIVPGVAGKVIRAYRLFLVVSTATNLVFKAGATALTGALAMTANGSITLDFDIDAEPWFTTGAGEDLIINQSGTAQISGRVYFTQS